jgi:hypothetical protein
LCHRPVTLKKNNDFKADMKKIILNTGIKFSGSFSGVESGRDVTLTPHPLLVPRSKKRVELYIYSP